MSIWVGSDGSRWRFIRFSNSWETEVSQGVWVTSVQPSGLRRSDVSTPSASVQIIETQGPPGPTGPTGPTGPSTIVGVDGLQDALDAKQAFDADLAAFAALAPANDDVVQRKGGTWINRNPTQLKTDLNLGTADVSGLEAAIAVKADDSAVVHKTGDETVAGDKTFSDNVKVGGGTNSGATLEVGGTTDMYYLSMQGSTAIDNTRHAMLRSLDISNGAASIDSDGNITGANLSGTNTGDQDLSGYATSAAMTTAITNAVNALIAGSPGALDTLNELATALGNDANFATTVTNAINAKYTKPGSGIPKSDLVAAVQTSLGLADSATQGGYVKPGPGIPKSDLVAAVQTSLGLADTAVQTATSSAATASTLALRDAQANLTADAFVPGLTSTATTGGTTTLPSDATEIQAFTGSANQTVVLPTTGIVAGQRFTIMNRTSANSITIQSSGLNNVVTGMGVNYEATLTALQAAPTAATHWAYRLTAANSFTASSVAGTIPFRDNQSNLVADAFIPGATSVVTAAGTTTMTVDSTEVQIFTGTSTQTVVLPTTGIAAGQRYSINNLSTGAVAVQASNLVQLKSVGAGATLEVVALQATPTTTAHWNFVVGSIFSTSIAASATTLAVRDAQANLIADNFIPGLTSTPTAAGTTVLTVDSNQTQVFTGSTTQTVTLPTTSIVAGQGFTIINQSSGLVTVNASGGGTLYALGTSQFIAVIATVATPTTAAHWNILGPFLSGGQAISSGATASTLAFRNAQANLIADNFIAGQASVTTAAGTTTLTVDSPFMTVFTGSTTQTVVLPTTSIVAGQGFMLLNNSTGNVSMQASDLSSIGTLIPGQCMWWIALQATPTTGGHWTPGYLPTIATRATASVSSVAARDASANLLANGFIPNLTSIATAAGNTAFAAGSPEIVVYTGTTTQTATLPTTGVASGQRFTIINNSTGVVTVNASGGTLVATLPGGGTNVIVEALQAAPTTNAHWANVGVFGRPKFVEYTNSSTASPVTASGVAVPTGATGVKVTIIPPGPGGGSGRRGAAGTARGGGGGGVGAPVVRDYTIAIPAGVLTYVYYLGIVGAGGAAVTTNDTDGNNAANVGACYFGFSGQPVVGTSATSLLSGFAGTTVGGAGGNGGVLAAPSVNASLFVMGGQGGAATPTGSAGQDAWVPNNAPGGGGGGGISAADVAGNGGNSGALRSAANSFSLGGVVDTTPPATPLASNSTAVPGQGGPGGAASKTAAAQAGANGVGYGAPGGGGGASLNGFNSGKGGDGGPAYMRLEWIYA